MALAVVPLKPVKRALQTAFCDEKAFLTFWHNNCIYLLVTGTKYKSHTRHVFTSYQARRYFSGVFRAANGLQHTTLFAQVTTLHCTAANYTLFLKGEKL
jgi:hypothetical protein